VRDAFSKWQATLGQPENMNGAFRHFQPGR
jgi:hypothetical protein